jgi:hypothetical protein
MQSQPFSSLGAKVELSKEVVERAARTGNEVCSHSYQHLHAWECNPISVYRDIQHGLPTVKAKKFLIRFDVKVAACLCTTWIDLDLPSGMSLYSL